MRKPVLTFAWTSACCLAAGAVSWPVEWFAIPSLQAAEVATSAAGDEPPAAGKVTSAAEIQAMFYEGLIKRGVPAGVAALLTADTQIISEDGNHIRFAQTMIGVGKRDVEFAFKAAEPETTERVAMTLDDGRVVLAESIDLSGPIDGYRTSAAVFIPAESVPPELQKQPELGQDRPGWLEWVGVRNALAQAPGSGLAATFSDAFSSSGSTSTSGSGMQSLVQGAEQAFSGQTIDFVKIASDVASAIEPKVEGPKTQWQQRTDTVKAGAKVFEHGAKVYKTLKQDDAMRQRLRALKDCAENPTEPTARDAQRNDPNYRRATTEAIEDAERNLKLNTTISIVASTGNAIASVLLGSRGKAVSLLGKLEDKMLQHVAEEYIMKDAGKGVVPCRPDCGPVYSPPPPTEQEASYPPAEMSCEQPRPEELVCRAAPASSSAAGSGANVSQAPPPPTPPPAATCGILTHAEFTYTYEWSSSGCLAGLFCGSGSKYYLYSGTATLSPDGTEGYQGRGPGSYQAVETAEERGQGACAVNRSNTTSSGAADLIVNAYFSIDNEVTGGIDTSAMSADTSVVEILTEGDQIHVERNWVTGCDPPQSESGINSVGFDCHFYGVDLYRPGFYWTFKDRSPESGVCTLTLSR